MKRPKQAASAVDGRYCSAVLGNDIARVQIDILTNVGLQLSRQRGAIIGLAQLVASPWQGL